MLAIIRVFEFPISDSFKILVNFESRNGTCLCWPYLAFSYSRFMQLPKASRDLLIQAPSFILYPVFPFFEARSEPAKSIRDNFPDFVVV